MSLKILLVHNEYQQPGGEDVVFAQERSLLQQRGHAVVTYWRSNHEIEQRGLLKRIALIPQAVWSENTRREFAQLLDRETPDLVHVHNTFLMISPAIYSTCRSAGVPVVQTLHNYRLACPAANFYRDGQVCEECVESGLWRSIWHGCYRDSRVSTAASAMVLGVHRQLGTWSRMVDCYLAASEFARQKFVAAGLPAHRIQVKPNFVATDPGPANEKSDYAVFVGRLSPEKGLKTLLAAWQRLPFPVPLQIVGDGPMRQELEAEVVGRQLSSVQFRGRLHRDETIRAVKLARFLVLPSECYENFPMTIAEAFGCATPVICSRLGAMEEIVLDGKTGLHFSSGNPDDLARKVSWAWTHPEETAAMGRRARVEYELKYTAAENYARLMDIYHETIAARSHPAEARATVSVIASGAD